MPDGQRPIFQVTSKPGIQRDGTTLDSQYFVDGQWVRFYRGRARKMGGYRAIVEDLYYPTRGVFTFTKNNVNSVYLFNAKGANLVQVDNELTGTLSTDISPTGADALTYNENYLWQSAGIYDSTGGGDNIIVAHPGANLSDVSSSTDTNVYHVTAGDASATLTRISDGSGGQVAVSGGVCVLQPYVFAYGNDGYIRNSNQNKPNDWTFGAGKDANEGNFSYTKIVRGLPMRGGGQSPSGLFWSLDSLIKVTYVGGGAVFRYDPVGFSTVMSSECFAELDGYFFWMGIDRFYVYDGKVSELPNQMNINWVFDNLNFQQRQKVWATVVPRWGEIWWHFPYGQDATECNRAVVFNAREKTWYDVEVARGSGAQAQTIRYPIWTGDTVARTEDRTSTVTITLNAVVTITSISQANPGVITKVGHGLAVDDPVVFTTTGTLPAGLSTGTIYYVSATGYGADAFSVSATVGGTAIETTSAGSGTHSFQEASSAITWANHNFQIDQPVLMTTTGTLPSGLTPSATVPYYVATIPTTGTFTLKSSLLSSAILFYGTQSGTHTALASDTPKYVAYGHEIGYNKVENGQELAIESYIETSDFGFPTGGAAGEQPTGQDYFTRLLRVEPDFVQTGDVTLTVIGNEFAQDQSPVETDYTFGSTATKVDMREQRRMIRLRFTSNEVNGFYEMGRVILHAEPGDIRS